MTRLERRAATICLTFGVGLCLALQAGCGGDGLDRVSVGGTVQFSGKAVEQGTLSLVPIETTEGPSAGAVIERGTYFIPAARGPVAGNYRVEIKAMRKTGRQIEDPKRAPPDNLIDEIEQYVPARYNVQSKLTVVLQSGRNENVDFDLEAGEPQ